MQIYSSWKDCPIFLETEICENKECDGRHRRKCRYYKSQQGCYREEKCQYLHNKGENKNSSQAKQYKNIEEQGFESLKCESCSFNCTRIVTLKKHVNTYHWKYTLCWISIYFHISPQTRGFSSGVQGLFQKIWFYKSRSTTCGEDGQQIWRGLYPETGGLAR